MRTFLLILLAAFWNTTVMAAEPLLVVGHKNPDTDSIIAAIAVAHLKNQQGIPAVPIAQGGPNKETSFLLKKFGLAAPKIQTSVAGQKVILVDHSDYPLAPTDITKVEIVGLVDHHKLGGLTTKNPIEVWVFPTGSTNTIIARMYAFSSIAIPKDIAGGMLGAIISDTELFKSPTTTKEDQETAVKLAKIAGINDIQSFGMKLLESRSDLNGLSAHDLVLQDFKDFDMGGKKVGVAQIELINISPLDSRKDDLYRALREIKGKDYHTVLLMLTDIMKQGSDMLVVSDDMGLVASAFDVTVKPGHSTWLPGIVSRKHQIVPRLLKGFNKSPK